MSLYVMHRLLKSIVRDRTSTFFHKIPRFHLLFKKFHSIFTTFRSVVWLL